MRMNRCRLGRFVAAGALLSGMTSGLVGCSGDQTGPAAAPYVRQMTLDRHAITLALNKPGYDTAQLNPRLHTSLGAPLPAGVSVQYSVSPAGDTSVLISANGLVTAHAPTTGTLVIAKVVVDGNTILDTATFTVNDLGSASVPQNPHLVFALPDGVSPILRCDQPQPLTAGLGVTITPVFLDASDDTLTNVAVSFGSSDSSRALVTSQPVFDPVLGIPIGVSVVLKQVCQSLGPAWVYATATVYGKTVTDSILLTLRPPSLALIGIVGATSGWSGPGPTFANVPGFIGSKNTEVKVEAGASVVWFNISGTSADIVFDTPDAVQPTVDPTPDLFFFFYSLPPSGEGGNIPAFTTDTTGGTVYQPDNFRVRYFPTPGTYHFHMSQWPAATGSVVVLPPPEN